MVTGKLRLPSAKGKERLLGRRGLVPGRSKLAGQRLHEGTEDASSASLVLQIPRELECKSHRLPETPLLLLSNGGSIIGSSFPEELSPG